MFYLRGPRAVEVEWSAGKQNSPLKKSTLSICARFFYLNGNYGAASFCISLIVLYIWERKPHFFVVVSNFNEVFAVSRDPKNRNRAFKNWALERASPTLTARALPCPSELPSQTISLIPTSLAKSVWMRLLHPNFTQSVDRSRSKRILALIRFRGCLL